MGTRAYRRDNQGRFAGSGSGTKVTYGKAGGFANAAHRAKVAQAGQKAKPKKSLGATAGALGKRAANVGLGTARVGLGVAVLGAATSPSIKAGPVVRTLAFAGGVNHISKGSKQVTRGTLGNSAKNPAGRKIRP